MTRQPALWRAGVDLFGMADLRTFLKSAVGARWHAALVAEFGDIDKDAQLIAEFSPMRDVDKIVRSPFVYHGANDPRVPRSEAPGHPGRVHGRRQRGPQHRPPREQDRALDPDRAVPGGRPAATCRR
jgi:prolyl oligopeptidase PreP (S9A serine peptidase family)